MNHQGMHTSMPSSLGRHLIGTEKPHRKWAYSVLPWQAAPPALQCLQSSDSISVQTHLHRRRRENSS